MNSIIKIISPVFKKNLITISLYSVSALSFLFGVLIFILSDLDSDFISFFISDFLGRANSPFFRLFFSSVISNSLFIIPLFLSTMSFLGLIFPFMFISFYSFSVGLAASFLYCTYKFSGILYFITVLFPNVFLVFLCLTMACFFSLRQTFSLLFTKRTVSFKETMMGFIKNFYFVFIFSLLSSFVSACSSLLFASLFRF